MLNITGGNFIYKNKWITDSTGKIETDQKEKLSVEIRYTINGNPKYNRTYKSYVDLLIFNPYNYEYISSILDCIEDDLDTFLRQLTIPDEYIIYKQNKSLRLSPKVTKIIRKVLTGYDKVLCEYDYWYTNRYNRRFKKLDPIELDEYIETIKDALTEPYESAKIFDDTISSI